MPTLSICVCTRDRPEELRRLLGSIASGSVRPDAVLVSDDGEDPEPAQAVCAAFPFAVYGRGPRRGLCANRNMVIARAKTEYVSLIDDDGLVSGNFVERLLALLPQQGTKTILTGDAVERGERRSPRNPSFWGFYQAVPTETWKTINLNCNCFPRSAFEEAQFDERLTYGYEDMDLCSHLLSKGYRIVYTPELLCEHAPPPRTAAVDQFRVRYTHQARFITSMMRYLVWEKKAHLALMYFVLAPVHRAMHDMKTRRWKDLSQIPADILMASRYAWRARRAGTRP